MSHRRPAAAQGWTILSVSVRTRDGPDRLDHAYRRLCHSAADHQTGGEEPYAPPPTHGLFNARSMSSHGSPPPKLELCSAGLGVVSAVVV